MVDQFFDCLNVLSLTEHQRKRQPLFLLTALLRMEGMSSFMADTNLLCISSQFNVPAKLVMTYFTFLGILVLNKLLRHCLKVPMTRLTIILFSV